MIASPTKKRKFEDPRDWLCVAGSGLGKDSASTDSDRTWENKDRSAKNIAAQKRQRPGHGWQFNVNGGKHWRGAYKMALPLPVNIILARMDAQKTDVLVINGVRVKRRPADMTKTFVGRSFFEYSLSADGPWASVADFVKMVFDEFVGTKKTDNITSALHQAFHLHQRMYNRAVYRRHRVTGQIEASVIV